MSATINGISLSPFKVDFSPKNENFNFYSHIRMIKSYEMFRLVSVSSVLESTFSRDFKCKHSLYKPLQSLTIPSRYGNEFKQK